MGMVEAVGVNGVADGIDVFVRELIVVLMLVLLVTALVLVLDAAAAPILGVTLAPAMAKLRLEVMIIGEKFDS